MGSRTRVRMEQLTKERPDRGGTGELSARVSRFAERYLVNRETFRYVKPLSDSQHETVQELSCWKWFSGLHSFHDSAHALPSAAVHGHDRPGTELGVCVYTAERRLLPTGQI